MSGIPLTLPPLPRGGSGQSRIPSGSSSFDRNPEVAARVPKVWGTEIHLIVTEMYVLKRMYLKQGFSCSMHRHLEKDETFLIEKGAMTLQVGAPYMETFALLPGDSFRLEAGMYHSFTGIRDTVFLEVSTEDNPKDSLRLTKSGKTPETELFMLTDRVTREVGRDPKSWKDFEQWRKNK